MKNYLSICLILLGASLGLAQVTATDAELKRTQITVEDTLADGWHKGGNLNLLLNQSAFSNWVAGGNNNVAVNANVNYGVTYKQGPWTWDNNFLLGYGISKLDDQEARKTDDRIEINSIVGREAFGNWKYSFFANFRTQFTDGFNYDEDPEEKYATSGLFKPAYLTFGPGMLWRKNENLMVNLAPLTSKMTFVSGDLYLYDADNALANADGFVSSEDVEMFGVDAGESLRYELGFYAAGLYRVELMENVMMENRLSLYSNYLDEPKNIDIDYTMALAMQINKYLSTNLTFQAVYDDNAYRGFQIREVFGLGFNLNL